MTDELDPRDALRRRLDAILDDRWPLIAPIMNAVDEYVAALAPAREEGPDACPTCGSPGYLVPGRGTNPDAFIPDDR